MSEEFEKIKSDLEKISQLMAEVSKNWEDISEAEFNKLVKKYPDYLPSFDEFNSDLNQWIDSLE